MLVQRQAWNGSILVTLSQRCDVAVIRPPQAAGRLPGATHCPKRMAISLWFY